MLSTLITTWFLSFTYASRWVNASDLFNHTTSPLFTYLEKQIDLSITGQWRSTVFKTNVQSEVIPGTVKIPEWVPLLVIEEVFAAIVPDEAITQCNGREGE